MHIDKDNPQEIMNFENCPRVFLDYGGSDRKFGVLYNGQPYMLKFSEEHAKRSDMSTSHVNNAVSEYVSSHILETIGIPVHETLLGIYRNDEVVVGCKDFRQPGDRNIEFREHMHAVYESKDINKIALLSQIYEVLNDKDIFSEELKQQSIERFWDTFVFDALVGNFDRHMGNWGYIAKDNGTRLELAPVYDNGSTLFPRLSDNGMQELMDNEFEMWKRCYVFPSPVLCITSEKTGKVGYYDMLASGYDKNCTAALLRIYPKIDMSKIEAVIDNTPLATETRRAFYKSMISLRKELIIDKAYECCKNKTFDLDALDRILTGASVSDEKLKEIMSDYKTEIAKPEEDGHELY